MLVSLEEVDISHFLEIHMYLTKPILNPEEVKDIMHRDDEGVNDAITGLRSTTFFGRPNFDAVFQNLQTSHPSTDIGVFFCGPKPIGKALAKCCNTYSEGDKKGTRFFYGKENF